MSDQAKPPRGPAGWRQFGLIALLALIGVLLLLRGCGPKPATETPPEASGASAAAPLA